MAEDGNSGVRQGGGRLHVAVVRPTENQHVGHEEGEERADAQPDVSIRKDFEQDWEEVLNPPSYRGADGFHAFTEEHAAERGKDCDHKNSQVGLQMKSRSLGHLAKRLR